MTSEGFCFCLGALSGLSIGAIIVGAAQVVPRIYQTIEPYLNEVIELKKKRLRDRYDEEKAVSKTARVTLTIILMQALALFTNATQNDSLNTSEKSGGKQILKMMS